MLVNGFIFAVFLLSRVQQALCVARTECVRSGNFRKARTDHALRNHVVVTKEVLSRAGCLWECLADQRCVSYNFQETPTSGKHACELNDLEQASNEADMQPRSGYSYYEDVPQDGVTPTCKSSACQNNGRCMDGCSNTYKCQCPSWRNGHYCEGWTADAHNYTLNYTTTSVSAFASSRGSLTNTAAFTLCLWLKTSMANEMTLVSYVPNHGGKKLVLTYKSSGRTSLKVGGKVSEMYSVPLEDGKWHHLCVTWESVSGKWNLYVDGLRRNSDRQVAVGETIQGGGDFVIGQFQASYGGELASSKSFQGEISQLNVWGSVLNETTIFSMFDNSVLVFGNLIDWRVFQELTTGNLQVVRPAGISGHNYVVNFPAHSVDNYVQGTITQPLTDLTVGFWAKLQDSVAVALFSYTAESSNVAVTFNEESALIFVVNDVLSKVAVERFMDDFWHHFAFDWESSNGRVRIYVDGSLRLNKFSISTGQTIAANGILTLGKKADEAKTFMGSISGFNIWNSVLGGRCITAMSKGSGYECGNVLAWDSLKNSIHGNAVLQSADVIKHQGPSSNYRIYLPRKSVSNYAKFSGRPIPDLTEFSASLWFKPGTSTGGVFAYASRSHDNSLLFYMNSFTAIDLHVQNHVTSTSLGFTLEAGWFHFGAAWRNSDGQCEIFINGVQVESKVGIKKGAVVKGNGIFLIGQEMDSYGGGFDSDQAFVGEVAYMNVWSKYFSSSVFNAINRGHGVIEGDVVYWGGFRNQVFGDAKVRTPSRCSLPSFTAQIRRDEYCNTKFAGSGGSPLHAMMERVLNSRGKGWRCYRPASWKQNSKGIYVYNAASGSSSYDTQISALVAITD